MSKDKEPAAKSDPIDFTKLPEQTVTIIIKNKSKVHTTGLTLPKIGPETPEEDLLMALQRVTDCNKRLLNTIYYTLAEKPKTQDLPPLA